MQKIQMYDPKIEYNLHKEDIDNAIHNVLNHGIFINGPEIKELEKKLVNYVGAKHCITVSNGTDALKIALLALNVGINDEVITVAHTWISSAEVISIINAKPVFIDIDEKTFNMDPLKLENAITKKTKAIIVVSLYGQVADMDKINEIASKYNIPVIEDGAQSFGATYKGKKSCNLSIIGTTSFFPSKPLGCYGDGGACFTNDDELAKKIYAIKSHGGLERFKHEYIGLNGRLDTIQAAILNVKINYFEDTIQKRIRCANYYTEQLNELQIKNIIKLPYINDNCSSAWAQYSILTSDKSTRDNIVKYLQNNNINIAIFYPTPLHTQKCFSYLNYKIGDLPITENICDTIFNLPCYAEISKETQDYIITKIYEFFRI
jgi:UDP-2-acetamido-2-deoxy-ribo-hexuluronate aminotransferase